MNNLNNEEEEEEGEEDDDVENGEAEIKITTNLYIGHLSMNITDEMLRETFKNYGDIIDCKVMIHTITKLSKGYGFITYKDISSIQKVIQTYKESGIKIDGQNVTVNYAKERGENAKQWRIAQQRMEIEGKLPVKDPSTYKEFSFDKANNIEFKEIVAILEAVQAAKKDKGSIIFSEKLKSHMQGENSWYPIMRLFLPDLDRERPRYGLKAGALANLFIFAIGLDKDNPDARKILTWKDSSIVQSASGNFPKVLREVLEKRGFNSIVPKFTVGELNKKLDELHEAKDKKEKEQVLKDLLNKTNGMGMYWIVRIILKDLNCGLRYQSLLKQYHLDAEDAINAHGDLRRCLAELNDPNIRRPYFVELFDAVSPMLAKIVKMDSATEQLGQFVIEEKLDGDRLLVHIDKTVNPPKVMLFTRNGTNYTNRYGAPDLIKQLIDCVDCRRCILDGEMVSWDNIEGKFIEFGNNTTIANEMFANKNNHEGNLKRWLFYMVFDALLIDDSKGGLGAIVGQQDPYVITGFPLLTRRARLHSIFKKIPKHVELIPQIIVTEENLDIRHHLVMEQLNIQITNGGEGLILKSLGGHYIAGEQGRKSGMWIKVKPELVNGLAEEVDCLILGGYFAKSGRRASNNHVNPSVFLVGVASKSSNGKPSEFFALAKVGTGYNDQELEEIRRKLQPHLIRYDDDVQKPTHFALPSKKDDIPDVWLKPEHSIVLQVTGAELVETEVFSAGFTLRFPRVTRIRYDKSWYDCTTFAQISEFAKSGGKGLHGAKRAVDVSRFDSNINKRLIPSSTSSNSHSNASRNRLRTAPVILSRGIPNYPGEGIKDFDKIKKEVDEDLAEELKDYNFFIYPCFDAGFEYIPNHPEIQTYLDASKYIKKHGGNVFLTVTTSNKRKKQKMDNLILIASQKSVDSGKDQGIKNALLPTSSYDLFRMEFIVNCVEKRSLLNEPKFCDYLFMSNDTKMKIAGELDKYGDHYCQNADFYSLKRCLHMENRVNSINNHTTKKTNKRHLLENDPISAKSSSIHFDNREEDFLVTLPSWALRGVNGYFVLPEGDDAKKENYLYQIEFGQVTLRLLGGKVMKEFNERTTHLFFYNIMNKNNCLYENWKIKVNELKSLNNNYYREPYFLSIDFLYECYANKIVAWEAMPVRDFAIE